MPLLAPRASVPILLGVLIRMPLTPNDPAPTGWILIGLAI